MTGPHFSRWVLAGTAFVLALFLSLKGGGKTPQFEGRSLDAWYEDLCSGVYGGSPKASGFTVAYASFARMDSNAVPYLIKQLQYDRSGIRQKLIGYFRRYEFSKPFVANIVLPSERRGYAAVALREMGPKAEQALPALMEAWTMDVPAVKVNVVAALESILRGSHTDGASQADRRQLEAGLVREAAHRYPKVAQELKFRSESVR